MPTESTRHYLLGPVSACLARMYLLHHSLSKAEQGHFSAKSVEDMKNQLKQLEEKLNVLQTRITEVLGELPASAPSAKKKPKLDPKVEQKPALTEPRPHR
jgi:hypothetical protein